MIERKFHKFIFNWGYVEDARIVGGPCFGHTEGFTSAEEALISFRKILTKHTEGQRGCPKHGEIDSYYCGVCGTKATVLPAQPYDVENTFDSFWRMTNDDFPSDWFEDTGWVGEWELPQELDKPEYTLVFQGTNNFIADDDRWCEAQSEDKDYSQQYSWNIRDGRTK